MKILGIETSCDDTGIAILEIKGGKNPSFSVLSNIVSSQIEVHKQYGGVYPMMAKREHQKNLVPTFSKALKESNLLKPASSVFFTTAKNTEIKKILEREPELFKKLIPFLKKYKKPDIDYIAITNGPGLEPCLWVGVNFVKALSYFWNIPIIEVNHIKAHIFVNELRENGKIGGLENKDFPVLALVVSGGHTQLVLMKKLGKYEILGETRDDAAGECFDKCAKILGLSYPGGPAIAKLASQWKLETRNSKLETKLPRPMINSKDYDFSFSGLKTAVLYKWREINKKDLLASATLKALQAGMASEVQQAIIDVLIKKTIKAAKDFKVKTIILGGGVTANAELRKQFQKAVNQQTTHSTELFKLFFPPVNLSTDNGLMVAVAGYFRAKQKKFASWQDLKANANLRIE